MIRRLVKFFCGLGSPSGNFFKSCCEVFCAAKTCYFLWDFYNKKNLDECSKCKSGSPGTCNGSKIKTQSTSCCNGEFSKCASTSDCCLGCQDCDAIKFRKALEDLKYSSPCGHDLWRVLDDFLYYCVHMVGAHVDRIKDKLKGTCSQCQPGTSSCDCNNQCNGSCPGCKELLGDSHFMAILTRKFSSSYDSSKAKWNLL
ncbi:hypothetical protein X943_002928, partial [Babesia divergens]